MNLIRIQIEKFLGNQIFKGLSRETLAFFYTTGTMSIRTSTILATGKNNA